MQSEGLIGLVGSAALLGLMLLALYYLVRRLLSTPMLIVP
jgi:hypothetical protein